MKISSLKARQILDSRGNPTLEVDCTLENGIFARAGVPSGASIGSKEACELRDNDKEHFFGKGVKKAVYNVNSIIAPKIIGMNVLEQRKIDEFLISLDGTENKSNLGANAILGVSLAVCKAASICVGLPLFNYIGGVGANLLPVPFMNIVNGGVHANWQGADFQEYMIAPFGAKSFEESYEWGSEIYHSLKSVLKEKHYNVSVGDEGGFVPLVSSNEEPLDLISIAVKNAGLSVGKDVGFALDPASSEFYKNGKYILKTQKLELDSISMINYYEKLADNYPIVLLEDGLSEFDWDNWKILNKRLGKKIEIVGDDIFVTNLSIVKKGILDNIANAVLIKLNQIGTLSETIDVVNFARQHNWSCFVSHRSGETTDSFIADFVVGLGLGHIKTGAPARGERVAKYNQLLRIEELLGNSAVFAGKSIVKNNV
ncbi:MAG: phosphopyruvate hydratase [Desulfurella sp.]|uniref:phosphopyruvate hydratase n=1 Tax=Desulfurella sp. TaxID=1962857 RepID=UPI000CAD85BB|nr:phosphopyruvate hydratase [Desulfurella sp.]PMP91250.1 MAG: phosphopyruvate hydratase [Desulfurella sp.]HEX13457.1 phosphopyruvate hydratase [Desulfurella acetivorans]